MKCEYRSSLIWWLFVGEITRQLRLRGLDEARCVAKDVKFNGSDYTSDIYERCRAILKVKIIFNDIDWKYIAIYLLCIYSLLFVMATYTVGGGTKRFEHIFVKCTLMWCYLARPLLMHFTWMTPRVCAQWRETQIFITNRMRKKS